MSKKSGEKGKKTRKQTRLRRARIMVFGTFDGVHPGHLNFFKQAKKLSRNSFLIVSVARDKNVLKIKGKKPRLGEKDRVKIFKKINLVDKAVLGGAGNHLPHILREKPSIIALGYDQEAYTSNLERELKKNGLKVKIVRLKPFKPKIFKNSLIKRSILPGSRL